jgi:hypothetical protein
MGELGIHGHPDHFTILRLEITQPPIESKDLRRADKCKIERVEEEDHVLSPITGEGYLSKGVVGHYRLSSKIRGFLGDKSGNRHAAISFS